MSFDALPNEILCLLPLYINNIETFTNAAASCRRLRDAFSRTRPNTLLRLADASAPVFFSPHPHFLVAATARQASEWALGDPERTQQFRQALRGGIDGLYAFCLEHCGLSLERLRHMYLARFSTINPFSDKIDKMAGIQWYQTPNFWDGGVSEPYTIFTDADRAAYQIIIYGELFGTSMDAFLEPVACQRPFFDVRTRLDYWTYGLPDWGCVSYPGFEVLPVGPYGNPDEPVEAGDQFAMHYIQRCGRWRRMWAMAIRGALGDGAEFTDEGPNGGNWRKELIQKAVQVQGLEGMQLVTLPTEQVSQTCLNKVRQIKERVDALKEPPGTETIGLGQRKQTVVSNAPDPPNELRASSRGLWL